MTDLNREYLEILSADEDLVADWNKYKYYLKTCSALSNDGRHLDALMVPKMFTEEAYGRLKQAAETTYRIADKVIARYLADGEYRRLFPFSPELEALILADTGYSCNLPIFRADVFLNEDDCSFKFCEINTDGTSAMNEDREMVTALKHTRAMKEFSERYSTESFELFFSWVKVFSALVAESGKQNPRVAIVDFMESGTKNEFFVFESAFRKAGFRCSVEEIRNLRYEDGTLKNPEGKTIDAVYRRAVTSECMSKKEQIPDFLAAVRDGAVTVVGGFRTQVVHTKHFFVIARLPQTKSFLTDEENAFIEEHFPVTHKLCDVPVAEVLKNRKKLLVKPADLYGSRGVCCGLDCTDEEWRREIENDVDKDYVVQEYCTPYRAPNLYVEDGKPIVAEFNNMTGLFVYGGALRGLYSRQVLSRVTSERDEGRVAPCLKVINRKQYD